MDNKTCLLERFSNFSIGIALLLLSVAFAIISFVLLPVVGLLVAIPVLALGVAFLGAGRSQACQIITERTRKLTTF
jgi:hypothetical protein